MLCKHWLEMKSYEIIRWNHEIINDTSERMLLVNPKKGGGQFDPRLRRFSQKCVFQKKVTPWFFVTFNITISHILPKNSIEIPQSY